MAASTLEKPYFSWMKPLASPKVLKTVPVTKNEEHSTRKNTGLKCDKLQIEFMSLPSALCFYPIGEEVTDISPRFSP